MSLESWKREFYPITASEATAEGAIAHSLQKWIGLRDVSLVRHSGDIKSGGVIEFSDDDFHVTADSCALCERFYDEDRGCANCPLAKSRNGTPCDDRQEGEVRSPWNHWLADHDPEPMIAALEKCGAEARA